MLLRRMGLVLLFMSVIICVGVLLSLLSSHSFSLSISVIVCCFFASFFYSNVYVFVICIGSVRFGLASFRSVSSHSVHIILLAFSALNQCKHQMAKLMLFFSSLLRKFVNFRNKYSKIMNAF